MQLENMKRRFSEGRKIERNDLGINSASLRNAVD